MLYQVCSQECTGQALLHAAFSGNEKAVCSKVAQARLMLQALLTPYLFPVCNAVIGYRSLCR